MCCGKLQTVCVGGGRGKKGCASEERGRERERWKVHVGFVLAVPGSLSYDLLKAFNERENSRVNFCDMYITLKDDCKLAVHKGMLEGLYDCHWQV